MMGIEILENELKEVENKMGKLKFECKILEEEAEMKLSERDKKTKIFNSLDEDTMEIKESIDFLKLKGLA